MVAVKPFRLLDILAQHVQVHSVTAAGVIAERNRPCSYAGQRAFLFNGVLLKEPADKVRQRPRPVRQQS